MRFQPLLAALAFATCMPTTSAPAGSSAAVGPALDRQAVTVGTPAKSVLLGAARTGKRIVAVGERGIVVLSDDDGQRWRQVPVPVSVTLTAIRFADERRGFVVGHGGVVLATSDGGETWARRLDGRQIAQVELSAAKAGGDAAAVKSAERLAAEGSDKPLLDALVMDAQRVLVVGAYGLALFSEDGGASWISWRGRLPNAKELHLYSVRARGDRIVIAGEQGLLLQSTNAGNTFLRSTTPYGGSFFTAELPDEQTIIVGGLKGNVWRSRDGGKSWSQLLSPIPASLMGSALGSNAAVLLVNQAGQVLSVAADALQALNSEGLPPLNSIVPLDAGRALALSVLGPRVVDLNSTGHTGQKGPKQ